MGLNEKLHLNPKRNCYQSAAPIIALSLSGESKASLFNDEKDEKDGEEGKKPADADVNIFDIIGEWGWWQLNIFIFFFIGAMFYSTHSLGLAFFAPNIDYWCVDGDVIMEEAMLESFSLNDNLTGINRFLSMNPVWNHTSAVLINVNNNSSEYTFFGNISAKPATFETSKCEVVFKNGTEKKCQVWLFDKTIYENTIIDEWNIVCDREWLASATQSAYMFGALASVMVMGHFSDKYGRRPIVWAGLIVEILAGLSCAFSISIVHYIISRFLLAFGASAKWAIGFVLITESVGPKYRAYVGLAIEYGWALGYILMPGIAYILPHFRYLQLVCTLPELLLFIWYFHLSESPRWQLLNNRLVEAETELRKVVKWNKREVKNLDFKINKLLQKSILENNKKVSNNEQNASMMDLFRSPTLRCLTLLISFSWFVNAFVYFGLSLNTNNLGGNPFINFLLAGAVEIPAHTLNLIVVKFGRRLPFAVATFGGGFGCLAAAIFLYGDDSYSWIRIASAMVGKFFVTCSYGIIYVYSAEIYPTVVRSVGVGCSSMIGRIGSIIAPFVKELGYFLHPAIPLMVFALLSLIDGFLIFLLPETKDEDIPDTIDQVEKVAKSKQPSIKRISTVQSTLFLIQSSKSDLHSSYDNIKSIT